MSFDKKNIDVFFRSSAETFTPPAQDQDNDWLGMTRLLANPKKRLRRKLRRKLIKYMGGLALVTTVTWLFYPVTRHKKTTADQTVFAANKKIITPATDTVTNFNTKNNIVLATKTIHHPAGKYPPVKLNVVSDTVLLKKDKKEQQDAKLLHNFYDQLGGPVQQFVIDPAKANTVNCKRGTVLRIPADCFINENGKAVKDSVIIKINEFYDYADMLAGKLSTTSNGEQLVSGGMLYIDVTAAGKPVKIKPDKNIQLTMRAEKPDAAMQLFTAKNKITTGLASYGTDLNWLPVPANIESKIFVKSVYRPNTKIKVFDFRYDAYDERFGTKTHGRIYIAAGCAYSDKQIKEMFHERYGLAYEDIKLKRVAAGENIHFENERNNVYLAKTGPGNADSMMLSFDKALFMKLVSPQDSADYIFSRKTDSINFVIKQRNDSIRFVNERREDSAKNAVKYAFQKNYSFQLKGFGWINCDKFLNDTLPKVEFSLNIGEGFKEEDGYTFNVVFKNFRSVLTGHNKNGFVNFYKVPANQPVQLIAIGVKDGHTVCAIRSFTTAATVINNLEFLPVTPEHFKEQIKELDKMLN